MEVDNDTCCICFEPYSNSGDRRCVVTKCGHLFCYHCIAGVIDIKNECPKCRQKIGSKKKLITIFDTMIQTVDTSLLDKANRSAEDEKSKRIKIDAELAKSRQREYYILERLRQAEEKLKVLENQNQICTDGSARSSSFVPSNCGLLPQSSIPVLLQLKTQSLQLVMQHANNDGKVIIFATTIVPDDSLLFSYKDPAVTGGYHLKKIIVGSSDALNTAAQPVLLAAKYSAAVRDMSAAGEKVCVVSSGQRCQVLSHITGKLTTELDLGKGLMAMCCACSSDNDSHVWVGANGGLVFLFDLKVAQAVTAPLVFVSMSGLSNTPSVSVTLSTGTETGAADVAKTAVPHGPPVQSLCHIACYEDCVVSGAAHTTSTTKQCAATTRSQPLLLVAQAGCLYWASARVQDVTATRYFTCLKMVSKLSETELSTVDINKSCSIYDIKPIFRESLSIGRATSFIAAARSRSTSSSSSSSSSSSPSMAPCILHFQLHNQENSLGLIAVLMHRFEGHSLGLTCLRPCGMVAGDLTMIACPDASNSNICVWDGSTTSPNIKSTASNSAIVGAALSFVTLMRPPQTSTHTRQLVIGALSASHISIYSSSVA